MGLTDLNSSPEGGLVYSSKEIMSTSAWVNASVTAVLEVLHLLVDLLVVNKIGLEVVLLVFALMLEVVQIFFQLSGAALGKTRAKKRGLEFLEGGTDIAGLAKLVDADLCRGLFNNKLELCITRSRVNGILGGMQVMHLFKQLGINPIMVDPMLLDGNDRTSFYHGLVKEAICPILVDKGNNMGT